MNHQRWRTINLKVFERLPGKDRIRMLKDAWAFILLEGEPPPRRYFDLLQAHHDADRALEAWLTRNQDFMGIGAKLEPVLREEEVPF